MRRSLHSVVIIVLLLTINLISVFQYKKEIRGLRTDNENLQKNVADLSSNFYLTQYAWATSSMGEQNFMLKNYLEDSIPEGAIAVRLSDLQCSSCVDYLLFQIKKLYSDKSVPKLLILYSASDERAILYPSRLRLLKHARFVKIPEDVLITPLDDLKIPYLLSINKEGKILSTFLPENAEESIISHYLKHAVTNLNTL